MSYRIILNREDAKSAKGVFLLGVKALVDL
jgi:hypothetical protein